MIASLIDGIVLSMAIGPMLWLLLEGGVWLVKAIRKEWKR